MACRDGVVTKLQLDLFAPAVHEPHTALTGPHDTQPKQHNRLLLGLERF